eukprot:4368276-Amphidinium_carterae.1
MGESSGLLTQSASPSWGRAWTVRSGRKVRSHGREVSSLATVSFWSNLGCATNKNQHGVVNSKRISKTTVLHIIRLPSGLREAVTSFQKRHG